MMHCGKSYHDERGEVQDCEESTPCRSCLAAELQAVRDKLATAHEEILLSRQSEGETMADLLRTREELARVRRNHLRRMEDSLWSKHDRAAWDGKAVYRFLSLQKTIRAALTNNAKDAT